jgi:TPR repeat protein
MMTYTHKKITAPIVTVILSLCLCFNVLADSVQDKLDAAKAAYDKKEYKIAFDLLQIPANTGNAIAQTILGVMYENGLGVEQDVTQAVNWYRKAAVQGHASSQFNLGG